MLNRSGKSKHFYLVLEFRESIQSFTNKCNFAQSLSRVQLLVTTWTVACQAPLSVEFPRQEYWSGLIFLSPGDLPNPEMELTSPALAGRFFITGKPPSIILISKRVSHSVVSDPLQPCGL